MPRIHGHNPDLLAIHLRPVRRNALRVRQVVVHGDERRRDVGLLVQMGEPEAREGRSVVEDGGLVFRAEACRERVPRLRARAVHAVHEWRDGGGCRGGRGV